MPQNNTPWSNWSQNLSNWATGGPSSTTDWFQPGDDWGRTQTEGDRWGSAASGAMQGGAAGASTGNPIAAGVGALVGGALGFATGGPKDLSPAEQRVNNWDILMNQAGMNLAPELLGQWAQVPGMYMQGIGALAQQGPPDMSKAEANLGGVEANIGRLSNFKPERIDRQIADRRRMMETGMGSVVNPAMLASNQQYQESAKAIQANPNLSAQQKQQMLAQGQRGLAQTNALQQGQAIEAGMSAIDDLAKTGDMLVERALEAAGQLGISAAKLRADLAMVPYNFQIQLLNLLSRAPAMFQNLMSFIRPGDPQYSAAEAGGRTGPDWMGMLQQGADIYTDLRAGGGGTPGEYTPGFDWPEGAPATTGRG